MKNIKKIGIIVICLVLLGAGIIFYKHSVNEEPVVSTGENNLRESGEGDNLAELEPKGDLPDAEGDLSDEEENLSDSNENNKNKEDKNVVVTGSSEIEKIKAQLAKAKEIDQDLISVSPDNNYVAYYKGEREFLTQQLFLWEVGDKSPQPIEGVKDQAFGCIFWSPNSEYLFIDDGLGFEELGHIEETFL
ncbi:MAG: hypothetical protein PHS83_03640 [Clostridia bacterium]|nr:hypothetical protein [Clostridia bacterium]MDD4146184.1 hypothetical protein [Clostridia bacterium]MDD4665555.1 hypothetical protein [Clostridia bacterium]